MLYALPALVVGLVAGLATGGRISRLSLGGLRALPLLALGIALQAGSGAAGSMAAPVLLASDAALLVFALANVSGRGVSETPAAGVLSVAGAGMALVAVGVGLNLEPISADGGMPVRSSAIVASGLARPGGVDRVQVTGKHHLAGPGDRFVGLADVIPVRPLHTVVSPGDLVLSAGIATVLAGLLHRRRRVGVRPVQLEV